MKKLFYLSTCDTCKKIIKDLDLDEFDFLDIKSKPLSESQIESLYQLTGSYEKLFSKRAQLYRKKGLKDKNLSEDDYKNLLLEHYTFLKRPVLVDDDKIFIGSSPSTKKALQESYGK